MFRLLRVFPSSSINCTLKTFYFPWTTTTGGCEKERDEMPSKTFSISSRKAFLFCRVRRRKTFPIESWNQVWPSAINCCSLFSLLFSSAPISCRWEFIEGTFLRRACRFLYLKSLCLCWQHKLLLRKQIESINYRKAFLFFMAKKKVHRREREGTWTLTWEISTNDSIEGVAHPICFDATWYGRQREKEIH